MFFLVKPEFVHETDWEEEEEEEVLVVAEEEGVDDLLGEEDLGEDARNIYFGNKKREWTWFWKMYHIFLLMSNCTLSETIKTIKNK